MVQQQTADLDEVFGALADSTRRAILERLRRREASVGELAQGFSMTLTGLQKHVRVLERAGLVATEKRGRVRTCRLGPARLDAVEEWVRNHRAMWEQRLDRLEELLERNSDEEEQR